MNIVNVKTDYELKNVITVYERSYAGDSIGLTYYLETHEVEKQGAVAKVGPGRPLTEQTMFSLGSFLRARDKNVKMRKGLLPDNLMYIDSEYQTYIWYVPEHAGEIKFSDDCGIASGKFHHPNLLFKADASNLFVLAFKDKKPTLRTKLFHAPYLNLYDRGNMCKGDIKLDSVHDANTHAEFMKAWQGLFYHSRFSTGLGKDSAFADMVAANRKAPRFNYKTLKKTDLELSDLIPQ